MKNYLLSAFGSLAVLSALSFSSCQEDKCKSVVCAYSGTCNDDGSCTCQVGYEGERCETISRDKFKGIYDVHESGSSSGPIRFSSAIENGDAIDQVHIRNFYNLFDVNVTGNIIGDTLFIPLQNVADGEDIKEVEGKGFIDKAGYYGLQGSMILRYRVKSSDGSVNNFGMDGADNPSRWSK